MKSKYIKPTLVILGKEIRTIEINGVAYVSARDTSDVFGLDWRRQKQALLTPDSVILYGVIDISTSDFADSLSLCSGYRADKQDEIYLRMDRSTMFVARVSTERMRANGNNEGAEAILAKQLDYAQALHDYETLGIAINRNHFGAEEILCKQRLAVGKLIQIKTNTPDLADRRVLSQLIGDAAAEIGAAYQPDLIDAK